MEGADLINSIKRSFRRYMNGAAAASMREKGLRYGVNWGISLTNLRQMAAGYQQDEALASALWNEKSRECRILATMLMPPSRFDTDTAERWMGEIDTNEMAEQLAFNLLRHVPFALEMALAEVGSANSYARLCAIHTLSRLLAERKISAADIPPATRSAIAALQSSPDMAVAHAAFNCCSRLGID